MGLALLATPHTSDSYYGHWLAEVAVLATAEEQAVFGSLTEDSDRDAFVRAFWQARDPHPTMPGNAAREQWDAHHQRALQKIGDWTDPRFEALRLLGRPDVLNRLDCRVNRDRALLPLMEIWHYVEDPDAAAEPIEGDLWLVFVQRPGASVPRLWSRHDDPFDLVMKRRQAWRFDGSMRVSTKRYYRHSTQDAAAFEHCVALNPKPIEALEQAVLAARSLAEIHERAHVPVVPDWTKAFVDARSPQPEALQPLPGTVEVGYPGMLHGQTMLEVRLRLDREAVLLGQTHAGFELRCEVTRRGESRDRAHWSLFVEADAAASTVPLAFFRGVAPDATHLRLELVETVERRTYVSVVPLTPPEHQTGFPVGRPLPSGYHPLGTGGLELVLAGHHIEILDLGVGPKVGRLHVQAMARGPRLAAVEWHLDGVVVAESRSAPYEATLGLDSLPIRQQLAAVAVDRDGHVLARAEALLNGGPHRLGVRVIEPRPGGRYQGMSRIRVELERPATALLRQVELFVDDEPVALLFEEPFEAQADLGASLSLVRAVATLEDGRTAEDVVLVNAPGHGTEMDVDLIELYTAVRDRNGRAIHGLTAADFTVREDDVAQPLQRFERIETMPIHVLLALDASDSMRPRMRRASQAADAFLRRVVSPKDRAALVAFNHLPSLLGSFTNDGNVLAQQLTALHASGGTALYDSLVFALYQFGGLHGKRALVLISDGEDEHSQYDVRQAVEFAKRAGIAIYPIGIGFSPALVRHPRRIDPDSQPYVRLLRYLAAATGGLAHFVDTDANLTAALSKIEEDLRSQYLLVYASPEGREAFRRVEVEVHQPGAQARTIQGYFSDG